MQKSQLKKTSSSPHKLTQQRIKKKNVTKAKSMKTSKRTITTSPLTRLPTQPHHSTTTAPTIPISTRLSNKNKKPYRISSRSIQMQGDEIDEISVSDPRLPSTNPAVILEMSQVRPQAWGERMTLMGALLLANRRDRKKWKQWKDPQQFSAKYAIEVYTLVNQSISNPLSNYSYDLHSVSSKSADLEHPISKQLHSLSVAADTVFSSAFEYLQHNGVPFPWKTHDEIEMKLTLQPELGISPEFSLFQTKVNKLLFRTKSILKKKNKEVNPEHIHSAPQTYMADNVDNKDNNQGDDTDGDENPFSHVDNEEDEEQNNSPDDIAHLRHLVKIFQLTTYANSIELDHSRYTNTHVSLDQARKMSARILAVFSSPLAKSRIQQLLDEDVDSLGSLEPSEIAAWQSDRFTAVLNAITPFLIKLLGDEFKLKGEQGYVAAIDGITQYLWDPQVAQSYGNFRAGLEHYIIPPEDTPELREEMRIEQMRRRTGMREVMGEEAGDDENNDTTTPQQQLHTANGSKWKDFEDSLVPPTQPKVKKSYTKQQAPVIKEEGAEIDDEHDYIVQMENLREIHGNSYGTKSAPKPSQQQVLPPTTHVTPEATVTDTVTPQQIQKPTQPTQPTQQPLNKPTALHPSQRQRAAPAQIKRQ